MPNAVSGLGRAKAVAHRAKETLGMLFYTKPQTYSVTYTTIIRSFAKTPTHLPIALPLPRNTPQQTVQTEPKLEPSGFLIEEDEQFKNGYAVWDESLSASDERVLSYSTTISVAPSHIALSRPLHISDYNHIPLDMRSPYLTSNTYIQAQDPRIRSIADSIRGTETLVYPIMQRIYTYVISRLVYGDPITGLYSSVQAIERPSVDCGGFATLFVALCIACGIPARVVSGFWMGYPNATMHAWAEAMLPDGRWLPVDPATESLAKQNRTRRSGRFGYVGSDRMICSYGCDIPLRIGGKMVYAPLLQHPFLASDPQMVTVTTRVTSSRV